MTNTVNNFEKGDVVLYIPTHANGDSFHPDCDKGFVTSKNEQYVFVRYAGVFSWATNPQLLVKMLVVDRLTQSYKNNLNSEQRT